MNLYLIAAMLCAVLIVGPLVMAAVGLLDRRRPHAAHSTFRWNWTLALRSTLLYVLAFNLTFFVQEVFLVFPKALTPGLTPTLYHNNHTWEGVHPLAALFQGTGAVGTLLSALLCAVLLRMRAARSLDAPLWLVWMVYCGVFMALPQFAIGALSDGSDLGMALVYLELGDTTRTALGLLALAALPFVAIALLRPLLALADAPQQIATPGARTRFVLVIATLPLLVGTVLILPFRVPREWIEVVLLPAWVALLGLVWLQSCAWRVRDVAARSPHPRSLWMPLVATVALLLVFQLALRPGIRF